MRQIVCPACSAANRIPDEKNPSSAGCGRCHEPLFAGRPFEVNRAQLNAHRASTRGAAVLVDVWAPWCGPCQAMAPQFAASAALLEPDVRLLKLNSDAEPQAASELGVRGIPTLILFQDGAVVGQRSGLMSSDQIVAWTRQALARVSARTAPESER